MDQLRPMGQVACFIFLAALVGNVVSIYMFGYWDLPPKNRDGVDYESIAWNLYEGRGYGHAWEDPGFREPYEAYHATGRYDQHLSRRGSYSPTAYRPPMLPMILAGIYQGVGRSFLAWRLFNCAVVAGAMTLAVLVVWRLVGPVPAMITGGFALFDPILKKYAGYFLTEGLACLGVMMLVWSLIRLYEHRRVYHAALVGVVMGGLVLVRSLFVLWYPLGLGLVVWCWVCGRWAHHTSGDGGWRANRQGLGWAVTAFVAFALAVPTPWWVRNCIVLDSFMPLGTQGGAGLPGGYSDAAMSHYGHWVADEASYTLYRQPEGIDVPGIVQERELAIAGQEKALAWIVSHPFEVVLLAVYKLFNLWSQPRIYSVLLLGMACLGLGWARVHSVLWLCWSLVAYNSLVAMLTYVGGGGRFLIPIQLVLHVLVGVGLWRFGEWMEARKKRVPVATG